MSLHIGKILCTQRLGGDRGIFDCTCILLCIQFISCYRFRWPWSLLNKQIDNVLIFKIMINCLFNNSGTWNQSYVFYTLPSINWSAMIYILSILLLLSIEDSVRCFLIGNVLLFFISLTLQDFANHWIFLLSHYIKDTQKWGTLWCPWQYSRE